MQNVIWGNIYIEFSLSKIVQLTLLICAHAFAYNTPSPLANVRKYRWHLSNYKGLHFFNGQTSVSGHACQYSTYLSFLVICECPLMDNSDIKDSDQLPEVNKTKREIIKPRLAIFLIDTQNNEIYFPKYIIIWQSPTTVIS